MMKKLKGKNIVQLFDVSKSKNNIYLFQELCENGTLLSLMEERKIIPMAETLSIFKQIISGYKNLYDHKIIHRDLKPANILIKGDYFKIADFGFAKNYQEGT